jgi:hypothetical protein
MTQQIVTTPIPETENICANCKHFEEFEDSFFCRYFDAFLSAESLIIPCDFQEKNELPDFANIKEKKSVTEIAEFRKKSYSFIA